MPHRVSRSLSRPSTFWYSACLSLATSAFAAVGVENKVLINDVHLRYPSNVGSTCRRRCRRTVMTQCSMRVLRAASRKVACEHASSSEFSHGGSSENERHSLRNKARRTAASFASFNVRCTRHVEDSRGARAFAPGLVLDGLRQRLQQRLCRGRCRSVCRTCRGGGGISFWCSVRKSCSGLSKGAVSA
jgi:hypothetical protein